MRIINRTSLILATALAFATAPALGADQEVGYLAANYSELAAPEMLEQLVSVQTTRDQVALSFMASRRQESAACMETYKADFLMESAIQYYHDQGSPAWLKKANIQTLVTMRLLSLCATTDT
jgi:hypothetical protein